MLLKLNYEHIIGNSWKRDLSIFNRLLTITVKIKDLMEALVSSYALLQVRSKVNKFIKLNESALVYLSMRLSLTVILDIASVYFSIVTFPFDISVQHAN